MNNLVSLGKKNSSPGSQWLMPGQWVVNYGSMDSEMTLDLVAEKQDNSTFNLYLWDNPVDPADWKHMTIEDREEHWDCTLLRKWQLDMYFRKPSPMVVEPETVVTVFNEKYCKNCNFQHQQNLTCGHVDWYLKPHLVEEKENMPFRTPALRSIYHN